MRKFLCAELLTTWFHCIDVKRNKAPSSFNIELQHRNFCFYFYSELQLSKASLHHIIHLSALECSPDFGHFFFIFLLFCLFSLEISFFLPAGTGHALLTAFTPRGTRI